MCGGIVDDIVDGVKHAAETVGDAVVGAGKAVVGAAEDAGKAIGGAAVDVGKAIGGVASGVEHGVEKAAVDVWGGITHAAEDAWDGVKHAASDTGAFFSDHAGDLLTGFKTVGIGAIAATGVGLPLAIGLETGVGVTTDLLGGKSLGDSLGDNATSALNQVVPGAGTAANVVVKGIEHGDSAATIISHAGLDGVATTNPLFGALTAGAHDLATGAGLGQTALDLGSVWGNSASGVGTDHVNPLGQIAVIGANDVAGGKSLGDFGLDVGGALLGNANGGPGSPTSHQIDILVNGIEQGKSAGDIVGAMYQGALDDAGRVDAAVPGSVDSTISHSGVWGAKYAGTFGGEVADGKSPQDAGMDAGKQAAGDILHPTHGASDDGSTGKASSGLTAESGGDAPSHIPPDFLATAGQDDQTPGVGHAASEVQAAVMQAALSEPAHVIPGWVSTHGATDPASTGEAGHSPTLDPSVPEALSEPAHTLPSWVSTDGATDSASTGEAGHAPTLDPVLGTLPDPMPPEAHAGPLAGPDEVAVADPSGQDAASSSPPEPTVATVGPVMEGAPSPETPPPPSGDQAATADGTGASPVAEASPVDGVAAPPTQLDGPSTAEPSTIAPHGDGFWGQAADASGLSDGLPAHHGDVGDAIRIDPQGPPIFVQPSSAVASMDHHFGHDADLGAPLAAVSPHEALASHSDAFASLGDFSSHHTAALEHFGHFAM